MTPELQRELLLMGVMPSALDTQESDEPKVDPRAIYFTKGYLAPRGDASKMLFDDPRDPVTGEVNH